MVMTSGEAQIQIFADWPMSHKTRDNGQQEKSRISRRFRDKETADRKNCPAEKLWPNHVKNTRRIRSRKTYEP